jgi:hypothetical protein
MNGHCVGASALARVLRTATQLEAFSTSRMEGDFLFAASPPEGFAQCIHPRLRSFAVYSLEASTSIRADGIARLRRSCFPRLRLLYVGGHALEVNQE